MGGAQSQSADMAGKPVVVIIGGGYGGIECAKSLENKTNCLLIDRKDYFFHNVGALRGTATDYEKTVIIPYTKLLKTGSVVKGDVIEVAPTHVKVHGHDEEIKFDYLVVATGTSYAFPAKVPFAKSTEVVEMYKTLREQMDKSVNVLIVGGGPVGIELAGEITHFLPTKKVTIVHSGNRLLSRREDLNPKLGASLHEQLEKKGVNVLVNERLDMSSLGMGPEFDASNSRYLLGPLKASTVSGKEIEADIVFFCNGSHVNCASYKESLGDSVKPDGEIHVNEFLQVDGQLMTWKNVFAIGDCCDADKKMAFAASAQGEYVAKNIIRLTQGKAMKPYQKAVSAMIVPVGPKGGAAQLPVVGVTGPMLATIMKSGDLFSTKTWQSLGFDGIPAELQVGGADIVNEEEKKQNLIAALGCTKEEAESIQSQMLPAKDHGEATFI